MKLALLGVLLGTTWLVGCAESKPAESPANQVSTTQLTSADAPLPAPPSSPLVGWYETAANYHPAGAPKGKLDATDPWAGDQAKPAEKAATPAVMAPSER